MPSPLVFPRSVRSHVALLALLVPLTTLALPRVSRAQGPRPAAELVVTTEWLARRAGDPTIVLLEVVDERHDDARIPGTRLMPYNTFTMRRGTLSTELPDPAELRAVFEALGVTDESHVVVYAEEGPMATRALYSLVWLGHPRVSLLDGGFPKWQREGRPTAPAAGPTGSVRPARLSTRASADVRVDSDWLRARVGTPGLALIDTRTDGEYLGTGNRSGMPSTGHLQGARQLEWEELFADSAVTLRPRAELARLFAERTAPGDTVVTYCWIGYRASATWFVARWLGYDARLYDGSYQDWSQRTLPTKGGAIP